MLDTSQKALQVNSDAKWHGTFAEIGAGQEVARWFFRVGHAANTVAKTISAYDMAVSDAIYGETDRYVSRRRLLAMLDHEFGLLIERLDQDRGSEKSFFVFADTVATRNEGGNGWMGVRFQHHPRAAPSDVVIHTRMLDKESVRQQEALGVLGVNLMYGALNTHEYPGTLIQTLLDSLTWDRVEVDMIHFSGPAFAAIDNRLMALQLVRHGLTEAAMLTAQGEPVQWAEVLYDKPVLLQRGSFRPVTTATVDVLESGLETFLSEPGMADTAPVVLMEMTFRNLAKDEDGIDETDFLHRADTLRALGKTVLISNFRRFHRVTSYLARYTKRPIGVVLGAGQLAQIFDEAIYNESEGGILGGLGQLFKNQARLYVYPYLNFKNGDLITAETFTPPPHLQHLYRHLHENRFIQSVKRYTPELVSIRKQDVLEQLRAGNPAWEASVPPPIVAIIKRQRLFGYPG